MKKSVDVQGQTQTYVDGSERRALRELRQRIASGDIVDLLDTKNLPVVEGIGRSRIRREDVSVLRGLHNKIKEKVLSLTGWGGIEDDSGRQRGYGYLPQTMGVAHYEKGGVCAMKELEDAELVKMDCTANQHASVMLTQEDVDACASAFGCSVEAALGRMVESFRPMVAEQYRHILRLENLVAAQPNIHGGQTYLPPHLDEPLHDGFGIVIVTLAVRGSADVLLTAKPWDAAKRCDYRFRLEEGQAYVLSGEARNRCLHGVLSAEGEGERESLNLRFGLHAPERGVPFSAFDEISCHWPDDTCPGCHCRYSQDAEACSWAQCDGCDVWICPRCHRVSQRDLQESPFMCKECTGKN